MAKIEHGIWVEYILLKAKDSNSLHTVEAHFSHRNINSETRVVGDIHDTPFYVVEFAHDGQVISKKGEPDESLKEYAKWQPHLLDDKALFIDVMIQAAELLVYNQEVPDRTDTATWVYYGDL